MNHSRQDLQSELGSQSGGNQRSVSWFETHSNLSALLIVTAALLVRLRAASGTFLNPDEALHYLLANQSSWFLAYRASLTNAHPPLLTFVLYLWRGVGTSELVLRLPSVIAGTAFCWIFFKWLTRILGPVAGFIGLDPGQLSSTADRTFGGGAAVCPAPLVSLPALRICLSAP